VIDPITQYWWKAGTGAEANIGEKSMQYLNMGAGGT
jgi:hypothetical protein